MKTSTLFNFLAVLVLGALLLGTGLAGCAGEPVTPIPPGPETSLPDYIGAPAEAHPLPNPGVPQNPRLAPNPLNSVHMDSWNSDVVDIPGPLGRDPVVFSSTLADARQNPGSVMFECVGLTFTSHGRLIVSCFGVDEASVALVDPETLKVYDTYPLEVTLPEDVGGDSQLSAITNGLSASYWYFDKGERFAISVKGNKIIILVEHGTKSHPKLELDQEYDVSPWAPSENRISGVALDWQRRIWFYLSGSAETSTSPGIPGAVYVLDPAKYPDDSAVKSYTFGQDEQIRNTLAIAETGVYVVTSKKMYRLWLEPDDPDGMVRVVWASEPYENAGYAKPGQYNAGSGTSPTILGDGKYVAITDNADPYMQVVVYRTDEQLDKNVDRVVCEVPVFQYADGGALDNSLLGSGLSLIIENNYGYDFDYEALTTTRSEPGFERIDIDQDGNGCTKVWVNTEIASTASAKLSTKTGLIYTYSRKYDKKYDVWVYYWTALDFHTGEAVWQKMAGTGHERFDTIWPALYVGPNETLYVGLLGGLAALRDTP